MIDISANLIMDLSMVKIETIANAKCKWEFENTSYLQSYLKFISGQSHQEQT